MSRQRILKSTDQEIYIVSTGTKNGLEQGRVVLPDNGQVSDEEPVQQTIHMMLGQDFEPFEGDPAPILELMARHDKRKGA